MAQWTTTHELLAQLVEMTHWLIRQTMAGQGVKGSDVPQPLRVRRPSDPGPAKVSALAFADMMKRG